MEALNITSTLVCPFNGEMISSSSMAIMSSKTTPMKIHIVPHPLYQSNRQIRGKSTHTCQYLSSVAPHPRPFLTSPCGSIAGESHFLHGLHDLCFIFEVFKKAICSLDKRLPSQYRHLGMASYV